MNIVIRSIALSFVVLFCLSSLMARSDVKDVVYLKNGSIIKGTILEMEIDKSIKLQTADGSIFVFATSEVLRISKDSSPGNDQVQNEYSDAPARGAAFSIFGGAAFPSGDFAKEDGGGAKTGFTAGAQIVTGAGVGWILTGSYSQNKMELPSSSSSMDLGAELGNWTSIHAMTGLKIGTANPTGANFFVAPLIGVLFGRSPEATLTLTDTYQVWNGSGYTYETVTVTATQESASNSALAYGATVQMALGKTVYIGAQYIASKPKYSVTATAFATGYSLTQSETVEQKTELIQVYLGIVF